MLEDPPLPGKLTRGSGEEQKEELVKEKEEVDMKVLDFNDINEVLISKNLSQKAKRSDDADIQVHWWDYQI